MAGIPVTKNAVDVARVEVIRDRVRKVDTFPSKGRIAGLDDIEDVLEFFADPTVFAPIYSLPRPLNLETVGKFVRGHMEERERGEGLLVIRHDETGRISGYSDFQIWPQWAAGELGGGMRADRQSRGEGGAGAAESFTWMFEALDLELICETAALDNVRTAKLLDHLGFRRLGEVTSERPDGTTRPSLVWEVTRDEWRVLRP